MNQTPASVPKEQPARLEAALNLQRKAALAQGGAVDHAGRVRVTRMEQFDMGRTIFGGLQGAVPRLFMQDKLAKDVFWSDAAVTEIEATYAQTQEAKPVPTIDQRLIDFMVQECDFSMEHADGTFLEHLVFCHDYAAMYFPEHSPSVALLHSILGTATNTFAMEAKKIPDLKALLTDFEALQVEAFPTTLRLLYDHDLLAELESNKHRLDRLDTLQCFRVLDNEPITLDAENLWINLNFHLMHLVDFVPAANWGSHRADPLLQMFEALSGLLDRTEQRRAKVDVSFPRKSEPAVGESLSIVGRIKSALPPALTLRLARKSIRDYSRLIQHNLSYRLTWR